MRALRLVMTREPAWLQAGEKVPGFQSLRQMCRPRFTLRRMANQLGGDLDPWQIPVEGGAKRISAG